MLTVVQISGAGLSYYNTNPNNYKMIAVIPQGKVDVHANFLHLSCHVTVCVMMVGLYTQLLSSVADPHDDEAWGRGRAT
jgi:hypothetical protein